MSWLVVVAVVLAGANDEGTEVLKVGPIEWLRIMGTDSFKYCVAHPHQPDARFDILSNDIVPTRKGAVVRVQRQQVTWDGDTATVHDLGEITVHLGELDAATVSMRPCPPVRERHRKTRPGLWRVGVSLGLQSAHEAARGLCMSFEDPGKAQTAMRAWQTAILIAGGQETPMSATDRRPWPPIDEGKMEPSFRAFRDELYDIVARKDLDALIAIADPACTWSFGADDGVEGLKSVWEPESPDTKLWAELNDVLMHGGMFHRDTDPYYEPDYRHLKPDRATYLIRRGPKAPDFFYAPYWFHAPGDAFEDVVIIGRDVPVHAAPDASSENLGTLSREVVPGVWDTGSGETPPEGWSGVEYNERTGYVRSSQVRSSIGYRAGFERGEGGDWKMVFFLAGD